MALEHAEDKRGPTTALEDPITSQTSSPASEPASGFVDDGEHATVQSTGEKLEKASLAPRGGIQEAPTSSRHHRNISLGGECTDSDNIKQGLVPPEEESNYELPTASIDKASIAFKDDIESAQPKSGHARKRSRDVDIDSPDAITKRAQMRPSETTGTKVVDTSPIGSSGRNAENMGGLRTRSQQVSSDPKDSFDAGSPRQVGGATPLDTETQQPTFDLEDSIRDPAGDASPKRKRSRDRLDVDADREQKIAATDEVRAQRLSSELDRGELRDATNGQLRQNFGRSTDVHDATKAKSVFGSTSSVLQNKTTPDKHSSNLTPKSQVSSPSAFAASGFAALANSSSSPFGGLTSLQSQTSGFQGAEQRALPVDSGERPLITASSSEASGTNALAPKPLIGAPVGAPGNHNASVFGGALLSSGFGAGLAHGNKLTSFAAPNGDAKFGRTGREIKPIGSASPSGQEDRSTGSDSEAEDEGASEDFKSDSIELLQGQDVASGEDGEESLFSSRASLFAFRDDAWKESGRGIFKFNVSAGSGDGNPRNGRFILRAHQTYRVLLNAPVFKQMKVGDSRGEEPTRKSFAFAVIENGKAIPHMVKLGDLKECQALYQAVRRLQEDLK